MKQFARTAIPILMLATLVLACTGAAQARTLILWPGQFRATDPDATGWSISQEAIMGPGTALIFDAPLNLPAGSAITGAVASWRGQQWADMQCWIRRKTLGGDEETVAGLSIFDSPGTNGWDTFPLTLTGVDPVIRKGYHYYVEVDLFSLVSFFGGIKVNYTPPAH